MDIVNCQVRHRGDMHHLITKMQISVAEVGVLRHIHGNDAVINIQKTHTGREPFTAIYNRLKDIYGVDAVEELYGKSDQRPELPRKLDDIGIPDWSPLIAAEFRAKEPDQKTAAEDLDVEDFDGDAESADEEPAKREKITLPGDKKDGAAAAKASA